MWTLASLLGCAGPAGFPALLSVESALSDEGPGAWTPVIASLVVGATAVTPADAQAAATPAVTAAVTTVVTTAVTLVPQQAPEAGRDVAAALTEPRRTPQPLASLLLSLADAVEEASAAAPASTPTAPAVEAAAAIESHPPERIRSEAIDLDVEIVPVGWKQVMRDGKMVSMWEVGSYRASWHKTSSMPGQPSNMVVTGHNNIEGSVFRRIPDLRKGDNVVVEAGGRPYTYTVETMFAVLEKGATLEQRKWNGQWIGPFEDERLTLVTCYPPDGNSHRMIVIARPAVP